MCGDCLERTTGLEARSKADMLSFFSLFVAARLHAAEFRTHSDSSKVAYILGVFLTDFTVFSLEPFADTLVIVFFVHWQTLAVVLTGPASAGCLQKNMYNYDARFKEHESCSL